MPQIKLLSCLLVHVTWNTFAGQTPLYRDSAADIPSRVHDLLQRMTTEEKVAQLLELWGGHDVFEKLVLVYNKTGLGAVMIGGGAPNTTCKQDPVCRIHVQNQLQHKMVSGTRLGIPVTFTQETMCSGAANGTSFPHPVSQGSSWNTTLVYEIAQSVAAEAYYTGVDRGYSPVLQVTTDPRFGRWHENFGGDATLVAAYASAAVKGLQGDDGGGPNIYLPVGHIVAEAKHLGAYGHSSKDGAPVEVGMGTLHDIFLRPWKAFAKAGGRALMVAHNDINGRPCHSNEWLLNYTMRSAFGFGDGLIASDGHDINRIYNTGTASGPIDAAVQSLAAGMDQDLGGMSFGPRCDPRNTTIYGCGPDVTEGKICPHCPIDPYGAENAKSSILLNAIAQGEVDMRDLNRAVSNVLRAKFAARLFDTPFRDPAKINMFYRNKEHRLLSRRAAAEGSVLLRNEGQLLPLNRAKLRSVAVVGPNAGCQPGWSDFGTCKAKQAQLGGYQNSDEGVVTVADGIRNAGVDVNWAVGADWKRPNPQEDALITEALVAVNKSDLAVVVLGDSTDTCGEAIDRVDLDLPGSQLELLHQIATKTSVPIVLVLINCRPATFGVGANSKFGARNSLLNRVGALLVAWNPGVEGGNAVADLLFGVTSPSGRLTSNWLSTVGAAASTPATWGLARMQADYGRTYSDFQEGGKLDPVLFPFGFGLDYLNVTIGKPSLTVANMSAAESALLSVHLANSASFAGGFAVQVYFRQLVSRYARPPLLLCNFTKVWLPARGDVTATLLIHAEDFAYYDGWRSTYTVDTGNHYGNYELFVCPSSSTCNMTQGVKLHLHATSRRKLPE